MVLWWAAWKAAKKRAKVLRRIRLYDIRHACATNLLAAGANLKVEAIEIGERVGCGRGTDAGRVLIQTHQPQHPLWQALLGGGYGVFARGLLAEREAAGWPPYSHLALLRAEAAGAQEALWFLGETLSLAAEFGHAGVELLGPVPAPMPKRAGRYRAQLLLQRVHDGDADAAREAADSDREQRPEQEEEERPAEEDRVEVAPGDDARGFTTPLATLHKFQGFTDVLDIPPPGGVRDLMADINYQSAHIQPFDVVRIWGGAHHFSSDDGGGEYGREYYAAMGINFRGVYGEIKAATYRAAGFGADTQKLWLSVAKNI